MNMGSNAVLILAGLLVWAIAGVRVVMSILQSDASTGTWVNLVAWLAFLAAFLLHVRQDTRGHRSVRLAALLLQSVSAIILARSANGTGMEIALLVMVAGQLPGPMSLGAALSWVLIQTSAVFFGQLANGATPGVLQGLLFFGSYIAFQFFALGAASLAESEREARQALAKAHAELEKMHGLAVESARQAERLRIARDLHDSLGHRLTALGLTLEAARHLPAPDIPGKVAEARQIASALIDDLRSSVGDIRDNELVELRSLLEGLGRSVQSPRIIVNVAESLRITSPEATTALFRMSQEIVTNAARHAGATELRLTLQSRGEEAHLEGVDNGVAQEGSTPGNGLTGIRERARLLGGEADWAPLPKGGFRVSARIPLSRLA